MDILKQNELRLANDAINQARRDLATLRNLGWTPTEAQPVIDEYYDALQRLETNQRRINSLRPVPGEDHEAMLTGLLQEEDYLAQSLVNFSQEAAGSVLVDRKEFFETRYEAVKPFDAEMQEADEQARAALRDLAGALQKRYRAMQGKYDLQHFLNETDPGYGLTEFRLPKPFNKTMKATWPSFSAVFFERVGIVFSNREHADPGDIAAEVFDKDRQ